jgi:hypothetical protein
MSDTELPPDPALEDRLRAHLTRVAGRAPAPGLENRVMERVEGRRMNGFMARTRPLFATAGLVLLVVVLTTVLLLTVSGNQVNNVFSNVSNGLNN